MVMDNPYLQSQAAVWGKGYSDAADTRPIATRWQREKSVKMMNSLKDKVPVNASRDPFATHLRHGLEASRNLAGSRSSNTLASAFACLSGPEIAGSGRR